MSCFSRDFFLEFAYHGRMESYTLTSLVNKKVPVILLMNEGKCVCDDCKKNLTDEEKKELDRAKNNFDWCKLITVDKRWWEFELERHCKFHVEEHKWVLDERGKGAWEDISDIAGWGIEEQESLFEPAEFEFEEKCPTCKRFHDDDPSSFHYEDWYTSWISDDHIFFLALSEDDTTSPHTLMKESWKMKEHDTWMDYYQKNDEMEESYKEDEEESNTEEKVRVEMN